MDKEELEALIETGEDQTTEFKESTSDLQEPIVAFANSQGGKLLIGITDEGERVPGLEKWNLNEKRSDVQDAIRSCEGHIETDIEVADGVIVVHIEGNTETVNKAPSGFFVRQDTNDQSMNKKEIRALFEETGELNFEMISCEKFRFPADVDEDAVDLFVERSEISVDKLNMEEIMLNLGVAHKSKEGEIIVNNAGVLLFGKNPQRFVPNSGIQCVAFESEESEIEWIEKKEINSPLILAVFEAIEFINEHTDSIEVVKRIDREVINQYPLNVLREALVNAIVHRDYHNQREKTQVKVYPDKLEISNPGGLIGTMSIDDLWEAKSIQRNGLMASIMVRAELAETMGTGIQRITQRMEERGYPQPDFKDNGRFVVDLIGKEIPQDLNERQKRALSEKKFRGSITSNEYKELNDVSRHTAWKDLKDLVERGILRKEGKKKGTKYMFVN